MNENNIDSIFTEFWAQFRSILAVYGWPIVTIGFLWYLLGEYITRAFRRVSTRLNHDDQRVKILDEERKRVRARQQLELMQCTENSNPDKSHQPAPIIKKTKPKRDTISHNLGGGDGGGLHFRPTGQGRRDIKRRRGG